jgi:hypothetical protein
MDNIRNQTLDVEDIDDLIEHLLVGKGFAGASPKIRVLLMGLNGAQKRVAVATVTALGSFLNSEGRQILKRGFMVEDIKRGQHAGLKIATMMTEAELNND